MANNNSDRPKMSTCPICGYTDTADDADALQMAIEEHIRLSHNLDPATLGGTAGAVKSVSTATAAEVSGENTTGTLIPAVALAPNSSGSGAPTAGLAPGAALLAAETADDDNNNNSENRKDQTSRF